MTRMYNVSVSDDGFDLKESEPRNASGFPWVAMGIALAIFGLAAGWIIYSKSHDSGASALEAELAQDKIVLMQERDKVFEMTQQLDAMKQAIQFGQGADKKQASADYNKLATEQRTQREKVKTLADQYNAKVAKLRELQ
jgi:hypothetical protein